MEPGPGKASRAAGDSVGLPLKAVYGLGQIASAVKTVLFGLFSLYFCTTVLGLSGTLVGIASAIGLLWDALIDPVIGSLSDRTTGALGKRHGYMLVGAAGMGVSFWACFAPPANLSTEALFAWVLGTNLLVRTMVSLFGIPYYALGSELSRDYHERTSITGIRGGLGLFGTMATAVLSFVIFFPAGPDGGDPKLNVEGYRQMGLFSGAVMSLVSIAATLGTLSHRQHRAGEEATAGPAGVVRLVAEAGDALRNVSLRVVLSSYFLFFLGVVINGTLALHFLSYYAEITESRDVSAFQLAFFLGALCGVFCWLRVSRRLEKGRLYFLGTMGTALVMGSAFVFLGEGRPLGTGSVAPLLFGNCVAGFFASLLWIIPSSMIADVADQDELLTGERRQGTFFGLFHFAEQIAAGAAILITGILIDHFAGLAPGQADPSAGTVVRIGMLYSLLPAALLSISAALILFYALDEEKMASIQAALEVRSRGGEGDTGRIPGQAREDA
jgi:GPH family glycoside/pentoside/hexuronide:cation symporter